MSFLTKLFDVFNGNEAREDRLSALMSLPEFQYTPLTSPRQIRLFRVDPMPGDLVQRLENSFALIEITMVTVSLDKAPSYLALSYVWGDPAAGKLIVCNEKRLLITKSLYRSLGTVSSCLETKKTSLCQRGKPIYLWADGICINQGDVKEKETQVKLMGDIYRKAKGVIAHVGAPSAGDPRDALVSIIHWTKQFEDMVPIPEAEPGEDHYSPSWTPSALSYTVAREFWSSTWFTRSWITQEFILAKNMVFLFGFGLETAAWSWRLIVMVGLNLEDSPNRPPGFSLGRTEQEISSLFRAQNQLSLWRALKLRVDKCPEGFELVEVLIRVNLTEASNPKDRIFAIRGLLRDQDQQAIRIDYSPQYTQRQLLIDVAMQCIRSGRTIDMLNHAEHVTEGLNLPSWVPEWIVRTKDGLPPSLYKAAGCSKENVRLDQSNSLLRIKGYIVDTLDDFGPGIAYPRCRVTGRWMEPEAIRDRKVQVLFEPHDPGTDHFVAVFIERAAMIMSQQSSLRFGAYPTGESVRAITRRVVTCDQGWDGKRSTVADAEKYINHLILFKSLAEIDLPETANALDEHLWSEYSKCVGPAIGDSVAFLGTITAVIASKKLATSKTGWFGVVPDASDKGDVIVIFEGGNVPFILRPAVEGQYRVMGACYIHGIMDGELFDESAGSSRLATHQSVEFVLC